MRFHDDPSQWSTSVSWSAPSAVYPTVHALVEDVAVTPNRTSFSACPPGFGLGTRFHAVPFQCRTSVWNAVPSKKYPAAQAFDADRAVTLYRTLRRDRPPGFGLG